MSWKNVQYENGKYRTSEGGGRGGSSTFAGLDDVSFSNLQNGQVPKYNSTTQKWENANESGGGGTVTDVEVDGVSVVNQQGVAEITMPTPPSVPDELSDLSDVQFSNLTDHQPLRYNATSQKWVNGADNYPPLIYSDEEREIGVWRDGKPLYQKTVQGTLTVSGTDFTFSHGISNLDEVIAAYGIFHLTNGQYMVMNIASDLPHWGFGMNAFDASNIYGYIGSDLASLVSKIVVNIQYTKTTDTAGSGIWTTQGGYAYHYSTTEHVIGTWIDGKPIYEKTISYSNLHIRNTEQLLDTNLLAVDTLISARGSWVRSDGTCDNLPSAHTNDAFCVSPNDFNKTTGKINLIVGSFNNAHYLESCIITYQYTKTTDV